MRGRLFDWLDTQALRFAVRYWRRKFQHFDDHTFDAALKSRRYVSKHHPLNFQQRVLDKYEQRVGAFFDDRQ